MLTHLFLKKLFYEYFVRYFIHCSRKVIWESTLFFSTILKNNFLKLFIILEIICIHSFFRNLPCDYADYCFLGIRDKINYIFSNCFLKTFNTLIE